MIGRARAASARRVTRAWALGLAGAVACTGQIEDPTGSPAAAPGAAAGGGMSGVSAALFYGPCPSGFLSECAYVPMPLDWSQPSADTIDVLVAHQPAAQDPQQQVWLLAGGPGESGEAFGPLLGVLSQLLPHAELFVMEHRGVGESQDLACPTDAAASPDAATAWSACAASLRATWGAGLAQFNTSNAARDLHALIARTRMPGRPVFVVGTSYGSYLALRFLRLFPAQADGADAVVLDSVVAPGHVLMSRYDLWSDPVAKKLGAQCAADATCGAKLGRDPWSVLAQVAAQPCADAGLSRADLSATLALLLQDRSLVPALFPLVYRLRRCAPADANAVGYLSGTLNQLRADSPPSPRTSEVMKLQIALSELWETPPPSDATLLARCAGAAICAGFGPEAAAADPSWPRYAEPLAVAWPSTDTPILAMHGGLDARALIDEARSFVDNMRGPRQVFVAVPNALHSVMVTSPLADRPGMTCGLSMLQGFVASGGQTFDGACAAAVTPLDLDGSAQMARQLFDRGDMWENDGD